MTKEISVIVPTWNRRDLLRQTIESFRRQTLPYDRFEVIVVDDGSTDGTAEMVEALKADVPFRLRFHRMATNGGPVLARNQGAALAEAGLLAFTDSDCQASPQWLQVAVQTLAADPDVAFLSGPAVSRPEQRLRFFSVGGAECAGENPTYPLANVVYRAKVFWEMGGFDPTTWLRNMGPTPLDYSDCDFAWRVKDRGHRNRFVPELVVYHEVRQLTPWGWLAHYTRLAVIPDLVRRHPDFGRTFLWWGRFCLPENPLFYAALAGLPLALVNPWFLLLVVPFAVRAVLLLRRAWSWRRLPLFVAQVGLLGARQAVICGSLMYGSVRARTLVL